VSLYYCTISVYLSELERPTPALIKQETNYKDVRFQYVQESARVPGSLQEECQDSLPRVFIIMY
jgi:hypothetical protein